MRASLPGPCATFCFSLLLLWGLSVVCVGGPSTGALPEMCPRMGSPLVMSQICPEPCFSPPKVDTGMPQVACWQWHPDFFCVYAHQPCLLALQNIPYNGPAVDTMCSRPRTSSSALIPSVCSLTSLCSPTPWRVISCYAVTVDQLWPGQPSKHLHYLVGCNCTFSSEVFTHALGRRLSIQISSSLCTLHQP